MGLFRFIFILSLVISHLSFAEVRYVSHSGSNIPPYLSWETAADSIMSAVNVSSFGDTIYVAYGVYKEQVVMIPGLSLIGAGMDSCVIDTRNLSNSSMFIQDSCLVTGFKIIPAMYEWGIYDIGSTGSTVMLNEFTSDENQSGGIEINNTDTSRHSDLRIYNNLFYEVSFGLDIFNSNVLIRNNTIVTSIVAQTYGIYIGGYFFNNHPIIDSNYIQLNGLAYTTAEGIHKSFGTRLTVKNNTIILNGLQSKGIYLSTSDSGLVANNLVYAYSGTYGIYNLGTQYLKILNNFIAGNFDYPNYWALTVTPYDVVENNVVIGSARGVRATGTNNLIFKYNNVWNNEENYHGFIPDTTNISVNPMIVNDADSLGDLDFHLQMFSPLIDAGDPDILDKDGTRSDIGLYGGPFGEIYQYQDLPPRVPVNVTASLDTNYILLKWNKNTEADFSHYNLYRDTTANFTADSTTFAASIPDTFYINIIPEGIDNLYFKLTAVDNQGNESEPSEELHVFLTGVINNEKFIINNYRLYQNYPNPFNPSTKIGYRLKERGYVKLYVYDIKGELVETLVNQWQDRGYYEVEFGAPGIQDPVSSIRHQASSIQNLASGVYVYQIMVKNENGIPVFSDINKMVLVK